MKRFLVMFVAALIVLAMVPQASFAHVAPPAPVNRPGQGVTIVINGPIQSMNGNVWVVAGNTIEVPPGTVMQGSPTLGTTVRIVVVRGADDKLVAQSVVVIIVVGGSTPAATASATTVATASSTASATSAATQQASVIFVKIIIDGPVDQIDLPADIIVVYGMRIKMKHNHPLRLKIKIGDWVHVEGDMDQDDNHQPIIIVIVIIIIDTPPIIVVVPPSSGGGGGGHHDDD
jgi:Domain of unknown function (DUF5666)